MTLRGGAAGLVLSALLHGALVLARGDPEPPPEPPPPAPLEFSLVEWTPRAAPQEPERPRPAEPEVPEPPPEPEAPPEAPTPPEPPPPAPMPTKPRPEPAPKPPAPEPAIAPAPEAPDFGLQFGNHARPGSLPLPPGAPGGTPGGTGKRERVDAKTRRIEARPKPADDACAEAEVKPRPLDLPQPQYAEAARAAGVQGRVRVQLTVGVDGSVADAKVVSPLDLGLDAAALSAVQAARFAPATRCGKPVAATLTIAIKFSL